MSIEPKEWNLGTRRSGYKKTGGLHVYINSKTLNDLGLNKGDLEYKQHSYKDKNRKKVFLEIRKVKKSKNCKHLFNDGNNISR